MALSCHVPGHDPVWYFEDILAAAKVKYHLSKVWE
jgi:hypothetical protein